MRKRRKSYSSTASSSNGRTADSDSVNLGSNPGEATNKNHPLRVFFLMVVLS